jgi:hypothetical protein
MTIRRALRDVSILLGIASVAASQTKDPASVWKIVRDMLSAPNGQAVFTSTLKGVVVAGPGGLAPYLQGYLVATTVDKAGKRNLFLSMEGEDAPDVTVVLSGPDPILKTRPVRGTLIRFDAVLMDLTKEPFMVTFKADHLTGLDFLNPKPAPFPSSN